MFRFDLHSINGDLTLKDAPIGWDSRKPAIDRNEVYYGLFTSYTVNLTFIFDGYTYLEELYAAYGVLAECTIDFYEYDNSIKDWTLQTSGVIDFTTRKIVSTVRGGASEYAILDTEFKQKIKSREDILINYNSLENLDGDPMSAPVYFDVEVLGVPIVDDDVENIMEVKTYSDDGAARNLIFAIDTPNYESPNFQTVSGRQYGGAQLPNDIIANDCFFFSTIGGAIQVDYDINFILDSSQIVSDWFCWMRLYKCAFDANGDQIGNPVLIDELERNSPALWNWNGSTDVIQLGENEGIVFYCYHFNQNALGSTVNSQVIIDSATITSDYSEQFYPTNSKCTFPYEIFTRLKESMTGDTSPIDAEIFNRPDTSDPSTGYGIYSLYSQLNGLLLRGFTTDEANLSYSFKGFYEQLDKILNIGIGIIDGVFVIKKKKDFFKDNIVHTFTRNDVIVDTLEKTIALDYYYSDVEIGFAKSAYEEVSGLLEYNNISFYNTFLSKINNKLELISTIRGDGYGMEFTRRKQKNLEGTKNTATEDTQADEDNFILDSVANGLGYLQRTKEGFDEVLGIDVITTPINLSITPAQNLKKWGWMLLTGLKKYADKPIKFNRSENQVQVETIVSGVSTSDGQNMTFTEFDPPIFGGTIIDIEVRASLAIFNKIKADPYGLIEVWNEVENQYNYGWIKSFSLESVDKSTNLSLIEAKPTSHVLRSWLWNDGGPILWNQDKFIALNL